MGSFGAGCLLELSAAFVMFGNFGSRNFIWNGMCSCAKSWLCFGGVAMFLDPLNPDSWGGGTEPSQAK